MPMRRRRRRRCRCSRRASLRTARADRARHTRPQAGGQPATAWQCGQSEEDDQWDVTLGRERPPTVRDGRSARRAATARRVPSEPLRSAGWWCRQATATRNDRGQPPAARRADQQPLRAARLRRCLLQTHTQPSACACSPVGPLDARSERRLCWSRTPRRRGGTVSRQSQKLLPDTSCGFESHRRHLDQTRFNSAA